MGLSEPDVEEVGADGQEMIRKLTRLPVIDMTHSGNRVRETVAEVGVVGSERKHNAGLQAAVRARQSPDLADIGLTRFQLPGRCRCKVGRKISRRDPSCSLAIGGAWSRRAHLSPPSPMLFMMPRNCSTSNTLVRGRWIVLDPAPGARTGRSLAFAQYIRLSVISRSSSWANQASKSVGTSNTPR